MSSALRRISAGVEEDEEPAEKPKKQMTEIVAPEFESNRLLNGQLEFLSIVRVLMDDRLKSYLWPRFTPDHFASETAAAIYARLSTLQKAHKEWPSLATLAIDPALPPAAQAQLASVVSRADRGLPLAHGFVTVGGEEVPIESITDYEGYVFDLLEGYRVTRAGVEAFVEVTQALAEEQHFDPLTGPALVEAAAQKVLGLRGREAIDEAIIHFGDSLTAADEAKQDAERNKLFDKDRPRFRTGIAGYDDKAGGYQPGEVVLLGASTGAGKTAASLTMMTNMARFGISNAMLQLELSLMQVSERLSANLANIDTEVFRQNKLTEKDRVKIDEAWAEFNDELKQAKARMTVFAPSSCTIPECEYVFKTYNYKVWFIDYVSLIKLPEGEKKEGWEKLSHYTKEFKRLAKKYQICIVICVQVNVDKETGDIEIRYAKAMQEDCDVAIVWTLRKEDKEEGVVWWRHIKARQYEPFDFPVRLALNYCRFESESKRNQPTVEERRLGGKKIKSPPPTRKNDEDETPAFHAKEKPLADEPRDKPIDVIDDEADNIAALFESPRYSIVVEDSDSYQEFD